MTVYDAKTQVSPTGGSDLGDMAFTEGVTSLLQWDSVFSKSTEG